MMLQPGGNKTSMVLTLDETLGAEIAPAFRDLIREALSHSPKTLELDCTSLTYIDSTGLGLLTLTRSEATRLGCSVKLVNVNNGHTRKVLELVKFDQIFPISYAEGAK